MTENNLSAVAAVNDDIAVDLPPPPPPPPTQQTVDEKLHELEQETGVNLTDEERARFKDIQQSVAEFPIPKNFIMVIPNLLRGFDTKFTRPSEDKKLAPELLTPDLLKAEAAAAEVLKKYESEYALLFCAKETSLSALTMNDWKPIHVPQMYGRAKILLVHTSIWKFIEDKSFIVRHHRSMSNAETSEVYEIYVMHPNGATIEYVANRQCSLCHGAPAPITCNSCKAPYCSGLCRMKHKAQHDPECLATIMNNMSLTVKAGREYLNQTVSAYRKEQSAFEERNRGKLVTVRRIDKDGTIVSESQEVVVPAEPVSIDAHTVE